jgi:hypothetical protein
MTAVSFAFMGSPPFNELDLYGSSLLQWPSLSLCPDDKNLANGEMLGDIHVPLKVRIAPGEGSPLSSPAKKRMDPPDVVAFLQLDGIVFGGPDDAAIQHEDDMIGTRFLHEALDHGFAFLRLPHHFDNLG